MNKTEFSKKTKKLGESILDLIYPPACPLCGEILEDKSTRVCIKCRGSLNPVVEPTCLKCGKPVFSEEQELCTDCSKMTRSYIQGYPALMYEGTIKDCLMRFKYSGKKGYADFLAGQIVKRCGRKILQVQPEVLVPVPVHKKRLRKRGYNQAELLAKGLSKKLGIPIATDILIRAHNTAPQKELSNIDREKNLKKAFISPVNRVKYKKIMLVDDIYTTGATIESCAQALYEKGASEVYYTSVCIGKGY